jgi:Ca-activated chloride channel family protein
MFEFEFLWALLLLPLPILVFWLTPEFRDAGQALRAPFFKRLVNISGQKPQTGASVERMGGLQRITGTLTWVLVILALTRPVWIGDPIVREIAARDMLLIVDLSGSMAEEDFTDDQGLKISRLDAVKLVLTDFIDRREGDRLGLAIFGDAAYPQAPFTDDHDTVLTLLDELQVGMAGPKTMMGDAIGLSIRLFEAAETPNKVAILLTDGNDTGSQMPVKRAATIAAEEGITIHTIAMGDPANVGENPLDTDTLDFIADTTGGSSFLALDRDSLEAVYDELDKLEPQLQETISYRPRNQLFQYPLAAMMLINLLLAAIMLGRARRQRRSHV